MNFLTSFKMFCHHWARIRPNPWLKPRWPKSVPSIKVTLHHRARSHLSVSPKRWWRRGGMIPSHCTKICKTNGKSKNRNRNKLRPSKMFRCRRGHRSNSTRSKMISSRGPQSWEVVVEALYPIRIHNWVAPKKRWCRTTLCQAPRRNSKKMPTTNSLFKSSRKTATSINFNKTSLSSKITTITLMRSLIWSLIINTRDNIKNNT